MPAAVGGGGGAAAVWASGETRMKANSSTKQRAGFVFMEIPKWIEIRDIFGVKLDPVTLIFRVPLNEILAIFSEDRWETTSRLAESSAALNNAPPDVTLQKSLMGGRPLSNLNPYTVEVYVAKDSSVVCLSLVQLHPNPTTMQIIDALMDLRTADKDKQRPVLPHPMRPHRQHAYRNFLTGIIIPVRSYL
jgi:hypothetical protein